MNKGINISQWSRYEETPIRHSVPVKLDQILAARLAAFLKAKNVSSIDVSETKNA